ncbi:MAG: alpha/beta hydrolase [Labilithrix sp.]|nr:alpha/beta hydrolase [Labilithrix sp.]
MKTSLTLADGTVVSYRDRAASGRAVVFVHGWMVSGHVFGELLAALPDVRAIVPDLRIAAASAPPSPSATLDLLVEDVLAVAERAGVERFDLVGHSMGGQIALLVAAAAPERVRSLALLSPVPVGGLPLPDDVAGFFRASGAQRGAQGGILDKACLALPPAAKEALLDDAGRIAPAWIAHAFDLWTRGADASALAKIASPTLVVASDDPFLPAAFLEAQIVSRVKGARLEMVRGAGHYPQLERCDDTAAILERFWSELGGAT